MSRQAREDAVVTEVEIDTKAFEIKVDSTGAFYTMVEGDRIDAVSLKALTERLRKIVRRKRVEIPVTLVSKPGWHHDDFRPLTITHGVVTGIHNGNGRTLFKSEEGKTTTLGSYEGEVCHRLTEQEIDSLQEAWRAQYDAEQAWKALYESYQVNERDLVEKAQHPPVEEKLGETSTS